MDHLAFIMPFVTLVTAQITVLDLARFRFPLEKVNTNSPRSTDCPSLNQRLHSSLPGI